MGEVHSFSYMPIEDCYGISANIAKKFHKLNIFNAWDLLTHFPRSYENRSQLMPFSTFEIGMKCLCQGIIYASGLQGRRRNILSIRIKENHNSTYFLHLKFFHFSVKQAQQFKSGQAIRCFGTIKAGLEAFEMIHPEIEFINEKSKSLPDYLIATYPSSDGLPQFRIRNAINPLLNRLKIDTPQEDAFQSIIQQFPDIKALSNIDKNQAIYAIHRPSLDTPIEHLEQGKTPHFQRLSLEELTAHRLGLKKLHQSFQQFTSIKIDPAETNTCKQLINSLPFPTH